VVTPAQAGQLLRGPGFGEITHFDDPHTVVMSGLLFLTRGRKPDHAPGDSLPAS
jgi:hypothetical protein